MLIAYGYSGYVRVTNICLNRIWFIIYIYFVAEVLSMSNYTYRLRNALSDYFSICYLSLLVVLENVSVLNTVSHSHAYKEMVISLVCHTILSTEYAVKG